MSNTDIAWAEDTEGNDSSDEIFNYDGDEKWTVEDKIGSSLWDIFEDAASPFVGLYRGLKEDTEDVGLDKYKKSDGVMKDGLIKALEKNEYTDNAADVTFEAYEELEDGTDSFEKETKYLITNAARDISEEYEDVGITYAINEIADRVKDGKDYREAVGEVEEELEKDYRKREGSDLSGEEVEKIFEAFGDFYKDREEG